MGEKVGPTVAVIVVAYQSDTDVARCLASIKAARKITPGISLWLFDNSPEASARQSIEGLLTESWMHYLTEKKNIGFAAGNNRAFEAAATVNPDFFFLLNADAAVDADCLAKLTADAAAHPAAAYGPLMTYEDGTIYYAGGTLNRWLAATFHPGRSTVPEPDKARRVSFINGCGLLLPLASYQKWGGLPEEYFMYYEEAAWCAQALDDGQTLRYVPNAHLTHYTDKATGKSAAALYYLTRNQWLFAKQRLRWYHRITAYPAIIVFQTMRLIRNIGKRQQRQAIMQAWRDALNHRYGQMA